MENYKAGFCNIGEPEIRLRKRLMKVSCTLSLIIALIFLFFHHSVWLLILLFFTLFSSVLIYLEVKNRFCVMFGIFRLQNFGKLGDLKSIECNDSCKKDLKKAMSMIIHSAFLAAVLSGFIFYFIHFTQPHS